MTMAISKNTGEGKNFPCRNTCTIAGVDISYLVQWISKDSITSKILVNIWTTMDNLNVFDRSDGAMYFFLLDSNGSHIEPPPSSMRTILSIHDVHILVIHTKLIYGK